MSNLINTNITGKIAIWDGYFAIKPKKKDSPLNVDVANFFNKYYGKTAKSLTIQFASPEISEVCQKSVQLRYNDIVYAEISGEEISYYTFWNGNRDYHNVGFSVSELGGAEKAKIYVEQMMCRLTDFEIEGSKWQKSIRLRFILVWGLFADAEMKTCMFDFFSQSQRTISNVQTTLNTFKSLTGKDINQSKFKLKIEMISKNGISHPSIKLMPD